MQKPHCHQVWAAAELAMFGAACCNAPSSRVECIAMFLGASPCCRACRHIPGASPHRHKHA